MQLLKKQRKQSSCSGSEVKDTQMYTWISSTEKKEAQPNGEYFKLQQYTVQNNAKKGTFRYKWTMRHKVPRVLQKQGEAKKLFL